MLTRTSLRAPSAATIFLWPRAGFATVSSPRLGRPQRCSRAPVTRQATRRTGESEPPCRRLPRGMSPSVWRCGRAHWTATSTRPVLELPRNLKTIPQSSRKSWRRCAGRLHRLSRRIRVEQPPVRISLRDGRQIAMPPAFAPLQNAHELLLMRSEVRRTGLRKKPVVQPRRRRLPSTPPTLLRMQQAGRKRRWIADPRLRVPRSAVGEKRAQHLRSGAICSQRHRVTGQLGPDPRTAFELELHQFLECCC